MAMQWSLEQFKELYNKLHIEKNDAQIKAEFGKIEDNDPTTHTQLDQGMVARCYVIAIFDYYKVYKNKEAQRQKLETELLEFAQEYKHIQHLRHVLHELYGEDDDRAERKRMNYIRKVIAEDDEKADHFIDEIMHSLHNHLMHPDDKPRV